MRTSAIRKPNVDINAKVTDRRVALSTSNGRDDVIRTDLILCNRYSFTINGKLPELPLILNKLFDVTTSWALVLHLILLNDILRTAHRRSTFAGKRALVCKVPTQLNVTCLCYRQVEVFL